MKAIPIWLRVTTAVFALLYISAAQSDKKPLTEIGIFIEGWFNRAPKVSVNGVR